MLVILVITFAFVTDSRVHCTALLKTLQMAKVCHMPCKSPKASCAIAAHSDKAMFLCREWIQGDVHGANARQLLHTQYHHREAPATSKLNDW